MEEVVMWVLVFVYFYSSVPFVEKVSIHTTMSKCFQARESLSEYHGKGSGYFNSGTQALCIQLK